MSTASDLLDALLAETDDESLPSGYSVEDALNDKHDFDVDDSHSALTTSQVEPSKLEENTSSPSSSAPAQTVATTPPKQYRPPSPVSPVIRSPSPIPVSPKVRNSFAPPFIAPFLNSQPNFSLLVR